MSVLSAFWPFRPSRAATDAERLLEAVTAASRRPAFFGAGRIADTLEGRLELMTLNAALAFIRLRNEPGAAPMAQLFADRLFRQFDAGLREADVGDLTVPKRMRKIASAFYGRLDAYAGALAAQDGAALEAALARNVGVEGPFAASLAAYTQQAASEQATVPLAALFTPEGWPAPPV